MASKTTDESKGLLWSLSGIPSASFSKDWSSEPTPSRLVEPVSAPELIGRSISGRASTTVQTSTTSSSGDKRFAASAAEPGPSEPGSSSGTKDEELSLVQTSLGHQIGIKRKAVSLDRPNTSILFSSDEINYLVHRYLEENGFTHTAYLFGTESNVYSAQIDPTQVPKGALVKILQKGVFFAEAERYALLGGDAVEKYEKTAGTISLLESANPPAPKKVCGVIDGKLLANEVNRLRKERRKDQISLLKQRAEASAMTVSGSKAPGPEVVAQQQMAAKMSLNNLREREHDREKETKESERKEKLVSLTNGVQPPGHMKSKNIEKRVHSVTPPSTSQHVSSGSRLDISNHLKESTPVPNKPNHTNNIHQQSAIGIIHQLPMSSLFNPLLPTHLPSHLHNLAPTTINNFPSFASLPNGYKEADYNFVLKQLQQPAGNGAGTPNNSSGIAQQMQLLQLHQQQMPVGLQTLSFILDPGVNENYGFSWNPKNSRLCAVGFAYASPKIFQLPMEKPITQWNQTELKAKCLNLSHDNKFGNEEERPKKEMEFPSCDWNSQGTMLVTATFSGVARLWNNKGKLMHTLNGHCGTIMGASFSPSGEKVFTIGMDRKVIIWETSTGRLIQTFHLRGITDYHWLNDEIFACCSTELEILILRVGDEHPVRTLKRNQGEVNSIRFDRMETKYLASGGDDGLLVIWDMNKEDPIAKFGGHARGIHMVRWSPKGTIIATAGLDSQIIIWHVYLKKAILNFQNSESTYMLDFSPNGRYLACSTFDAKIFVYSLETGTILTQVSYKAAFYDVSWDGTGDWLGAASQACLIFIDLRQNIKNYEIQEELKKTAASSIIGIKN